MKSVFKGTSVKIVLQTVQNVGHGTESGIGIYGSKGTVQGCIKDLLY